MQINGFKHKMKSPLITNCMQGFMIYEVGEFTIAEINKVPQKMKRHKTFGPDEITMAIFYEIDNKNKEEVLRIMSTCWEEDGAPEHVLIARAMPETASKRSR